VNEDGIDDLITGATVGHADASGTAVPNGSYRR
jgi:hypothetical protein